MKPNVWNVKDILQIPSTSMTAKAGKGVATSDYSSLTDSQFLFGSQFLLENSQGFSQEMSGPSRGSQPASQEKNELKVSTSYHSKPLLFGDGKANLSGGKTLGILDRFEEEKKKAKENEILIQGLRQLHDGLENIKNTFLNIVEESCDFTKKTVAESLDELRKAIQVDLTNIRETITAQAEILMNLQKERDREIKDSESKTTLAVKDISTHMLRLQQDLEFLKVEQSKEQSVLGEIQSMLSTIISSYYTGAYYRPVRMTDNTAQTSPGLVENFCVSTEEKQSCEDFGLCYRAIIHSKEQVDWTTCPVITKSPQMLNTGAYFRVLGPVSVDKPKQIFKQAPEKSCSKLSVKTTPLSSLDATRQRSFTVGASAQMKPGKPLVDREENGCTTWTDVSKQNKMPKRGQKTQHFKRKKRALILPQRRPNKSMALVNIFEDGQHDEEKENRMPLSTIQTVSKNNPPHTQQRDITKLTKRSECGQHLNPWSWSQSSSSSQIMVEYEKAEQEMMPKPKVNTIMGQKGIWQLFDFISDSD
ncbi:interactor of HORMAD1 protein 1 [Hoplias malabaricus]|uniref:interactor of HORMAD1 protein 1 n=1 Tax=Hoplias malabaricus TaxID=27720 RepID=UPI0034618E19